MILTFFCLPSLGEGISNTILEAMASGLPVVATSVGGNSELVVEAETGYLVPPADPLAMASVFEKYLDFPELIDTHGYNARKRVEDEFSLEAMVRRYQAMYDEVLAL